MSDAALILLKLRQVRRRIFFVHLVNSLSIAIFSLAFLIALFSAQGVAWPWFSGIMAVSVSAAAMMAAAIIAYVRTPGRKATAKLVDRKLALQQRLETALECVSPGEEVDHLLLRDATQRMAHVIPAAVVPVRFAQFARVALGAGLITLAGLSVIRFLEGWNRGSFIAQRNRSQIATEAPLQTGEAPVEPPKSEETRAAGRAAAPGLSVAAPDGGIARRPDTLNRSEAANPAATASPSSAQSAAPPGDSKEGAAGQARGFQRTQTASPLASIPAQPGSADRQGERGGLRPSQAQAPSPARPGDAVGQPQPGSGAASIRAASKRDEGPSTGAAGAAAASRGAKSAASSAGAPQPTGLSGLSKTDAALMAKYSRDYAAYRLAAEEALTKEKIPPGFRKYIADYFAAIHP